MNDPNNLITTLLIFTGALGLAWWAMFGAGVIRSRVAHRRYVRALFNETPWWTKVLRDLGATQRWVHQRATGPSRATSWELPWELRWDLPGEVSGGVLRWGQARLDTGRARVGWARQWFRGRACRPSDTSRWDLPRPSQQWSQVHEWLRANDSARQCDDWLAELERRLLAEARH